MFRFEFPELNNTEKMSSKVVSNLLYYQVRSHTCSHRAELGFKMRLFPDKLLRLCGPRIPHCLLLCPLEDVVHRPRPSHR